jgi:type IV pilus assembly protein PilP
MIRVRISIVFVTLLLTACGGGEFSDLKEFVEQSGQGLRGHVEPLPQVKAYEPMSYNAFDLPDPFSHKNRPERTSGGLSPDYNRRRSHSAYPLESLKMVGTLKGKATLGLDQDTG